MIPPRAVLTIRTPGLARASRSAPIKPGRLGGLRQVDGEEVRLGDHLVQRQQLRAQLLGPLGADVGVVGHQIACRRRRPAGPPGSRPGPRPTTPSTLPCSSTPSQRDRSHRPATRAAWAWGMLRAWASRRAMVCSAADRTFDWGALTTITPRRVAAATSTLSRPMPARPTTTSSVAGVEHVGGHLGGRADDQGVRLRGPRPAARPASARATTSTSCPAARSSARPGLGDLLGDEHPSHAGRLSRRRAWPGG